MRLIKPRTGESRIVFLVPLLWIAIKFPIIHPINAVRVLSTGLRLRRPALLIAEFTRYTSEHHGSLKSYLFKGILDNWREFYFYQKYKHPFCWPTYFSLFGLINIQKLANPLVMENYEIFNQICHLSDHKVWDANSHHFTNSENFCYYDKKLYILDYGCPRVQEFIQICGIKVMYEFDPNLSWREIYERLKAKTT